MLTLKTIPHGLIWKVGEDYVECTLKGFHTITCKLTCKCVAKEQVQHQECSG